MISPEYLAGVIDSDGSICLTKRHVKRPKPNYMIMVQLGWVDKPETRAVMDQLKEQYGGSTFIVKPSKSSFSTRDHIKYTAVGEAAEKIIRDILPHLHLKTKQAQNALRARELTAGAFSPRSDECSLELDALWKNNLSINDKNGY